MILTRFHFSCTKHLTDHQRWSGRFFIQEDFYVWWEGCEKLPEKLTFVVLNQKRSCISYLNVIKLLSAISKSQKGVCVLSRTSWIISVLLGYDFTGKHRAKAICVHSKSVSLPAIPAQHTADPVILPCILPCCSEPNNYRELLYSSFSKSSDIPNKHGVLIFCLAAFLGGKLFIIKECDRSLLILKDQQRQLLPKSSRGYYIKAYLLSSANTGIYTQ